MGRECGSCRMCCKFMYVAERGTGPDGEPYEFVQYPGTWCSHAGEKGCDLHGSPRKPISCRMFACIWLLGHGREEDRPDKIKVIASAEMRAHWRLEGGERERSGMIVVYDCAPGAHQTKRAAPFMEELIKLFKQTNIDGMEVVPFHNPQADREFVHKRHGSGHLRVHDWPPPIDADLERLDMEEMFGGKIPDDASMSSAQEALSKLSKEARAALERRLDERRAKQGR